jgi:hypothetical protein
MITLHTIIYDGNYIDYLKKDSRFFTINNKLITKKLITVNNITDGEGCNKLLGELKNIYDFDIIYVDDHVDATIQFFNLDMTKTTPGYIYAIPIFVSILNVKTPFIFHFSSDCLNNELIFNDDYLKKSIIILNNDDKLIVTTLTNEPQPWSVVGVPSVVPIKSMTCVDEWEQLNTINYKPENTLNDWWCSYSMTDNIFLGNIEKLKRGDYNLKNLAQAKLNGVKYNGPSYGGTSSFEYRMAQRLTNDGVYRLIYKDNNCHYKHNKH